MSRISEHKSKQLLQKYKKESYMRIYDPYTNQIALNKLGSITE